MAATEGKGEYLRKMAVPLRGEGGSTRKGIPKPYGRTRTGTKLPGRPRDGERPAFPGKPDMRTRLGKARTLMASLQGAGLKGDHLARAMKGAGYWSELAALQDRSRETAAPDLKAAELVSPEELAKTAAGRKALEVLHSVSARRKDLDDNEMREDSRLKQYSRDKKVD